MINQPREETDYHKIYPDLDVNTNLLVINELPLTDKQTCATPAAPPSTAEYTYRPVDFNNVDYNADSYDLAFLKEYALTMPVSLFELIIDRLEKEWYFFKHTLARRTFIPFESNVGVCNVCSHSNVRVDNNLVYCDGCNLCVHQECYGVPIIPQGSWFCKPCTYQLGPLYCRFCVKTGGAYKMTSTMKWGHVVCVLWNADLYFGNEVFMEPIEDPNRTNAHRLKHSCSLCGSTKGMHIQCAYTECDVWYHVTCAIEHDLYMDQSNVLTYCSAHDPRRSIRYDDDLEGYPALEKLPRIRRPVQLAQPKKSLLLYVKNMRPFGCTYLMDRLYSNDLCNFSVEKDEFVCVMRYWCKKARVLNLGPLIPYLYFDVNGGIGWEWYEKRRLFCCGRGVVEKGKDEKEMNDETEGRTSVRKDEKEINDGAEGRTSVRKDGERINDETEGRTRVRKDKEEINKTENIDGWTSDRDKNCIAEKVVKEIKDNAEKEINDKIGNEEEDDKRTDKEVENAVENKNEEKVKNGDKNVINEQILKHTDSRNVQAQKHKRIKLPADYELDTCHAEHHEIRAHNDTTQNMDRSLITCTSVFRKADDTTPYPCYSNEERVKYQEWLKDVKEGCSHKKMGSMSRDDVMYMYAPVYGLKRVVKALIERSDVQMELVNTNREIYEILYARKQYILKKVMSILDRGEYALFKERVTEDIAPNYFDVIREPMDFEKMYSKIERYEGVPQFFDDLRLIGTNCVTYNQQVPYFVALAERFLEEVGQLEQHALQMLDEDLEYDSTAVTNGLM